MGCNSLLIWWPEVYWLIEISSVSDISCSVEVSGSLLQVRDVYPGSRIPNPIFLHPRFRKNKMPDPGCRILIRIKEFKYFLPKKLIPTNFSKIRSGMFILDPGSGFFLIPDPGSGFFLIPIRIRNTVLVLLDKTFSIHIFYNFFCTQGWPWWACASVHCPSSRQTGLLPEANR